MSAAIFHKDFKARPFWWEAYEPKALADVALPKEARVVIVGAGYAGLSAALELNREGLDCIVLDANEPGFGASTRNGGMVSGGVNVGKRYMARAMTPEEVGALPRRCRRCLWPHRGADRPREDRLRLDQGGLFPRRLVQEPL